MQEWRFIEGGPLDGAHNMAVDEALLSCFDPEISRPVFRIYGWEPPSLSLGRFQQAGDILDQGKIRAAGLSVVRRITGGGVIYHADELTYSLVCAPRHVPPAASIKESFRVLTSFLMEFYRKLGLEPYYAVESAGSPSPPGESSPFCFAGRETYDIIIRKRKIGGNAQRRLKNVIFQHGSIPVVNRAVLGAAFMREPPQGIGEVVTSLREEGVLQGIDDLKVLMAAAFSGTMPATLFRSQLSLEEVRHAASLSKGKH
jgi:lipoate-protein ligase A